MFGADTMKIYILNLSRRKCATPLNEKSFNNDGWASFWGGDLDLKKFMKNVSSIVVLAAWRNFLCYVCYCMCEFVLVWRRTCKSMCVRRNVDDSWMYFEFGVGSAVDRLGTEKLNHYKHFKVFRLRIQSNWNKELVIVIHWEDQIYYR